MLHWNSWTLHPLEELTLYSVAILLYVLLYEQLLLLQVMHACVCEGML